MAELLTFMAAFDRRTLGPADVEAWSLLDVCQRYDLATCKRAVVLFFDQYADERGQSPYLNPHHLKSMVKAVRREQEREVSRLRAIKIAQGISDVDEADAAARKEITDGTR